MCQVHMSITIGVILLFIKRRQLHKALELPNDLPLLSEREKGEWVLYFCAYFA